MNAVTSNLAYLVVALVAVGFGDAGAALALTALAAGSAYYHAGHTVLYDYIGMYWVFLALMLDGWMLVGALIVAGVGAYWVQSFYVVGALAAALTVYLALTVGWWTILPVAWFGAALYVRFGTEQDRHPLWHAMSATGFAGILVIQQMV